MNQTEIFKNLFNNSTDHKILVEEGFWQWVSTGPGEIEIYVEPVYSNDPEYRLVNKAEDYKALKLWFLKNHKNLDS